MAKVKKMLVKTMLNERKELLGIYNKDIASKSGLSLPEVDVSFRIKSKQDFYMLTLHRILEALDLKLFIVSDDGKFIREIVKED